MSLFAAGAAAAAAAAAGTTAPLFAAAPLPQTTTSAPFLSFASAPDLGPTPVAAAARSGHSGLVASSSRIDVDLTAESPPRSSAGRHRKERRQASHEDKKRRRSERSPSRSRSRDRGRSRRSRSRSRSRDRERRKKSRDSDDKKEKKEKKEKKRSRKETKQHKETHKRPAAASRSPSPSDSELSDVAATGVTRPRDDRAARSDEAAVLAVALGDASPMRVDSAGESSGGDSDAEDLASSLRLRKAAAAAREAAEDQRKIMAIEQRLKDAGAQPSYFATATLPKRGGSESDKDVFTLDTRGDFNLPLYGLPRMDPASMAGGGWWMIGAAQLGLKHPGQVRALLQQRRRGPGEPVRLDSNGWGRKEQLRFSRSQRYYYDRWHLRERDRTFKRLHIVAPPPDADSKSGALEDGSDFVALVPPAAAVSAAVAASSAVAVPASAADGASFDESTAALVRDYNMALRLHPRNTSLWLHFVRAQELLLHPARRVRSGAALADKQLAILQRALEANPHHETLTLALLQRATQLWTAPQIEARFAEALEDLPSSAPLWQMLIDWRSGGGANFSHFKAESGGVRDAYTQAIAALSLQREKLVSQFAQGLSGALDASALHLRHREHHSRLAALTRTLQTFVSGYIRFLHGAGYIERALALWQGVVEFSGACTPTAAAAAAASPPPPSGEQRLATDPSQLQHYFEAFWDSDVPRFGEHGATGFARWYDGLFGPQKPLEAEAEAEPAATIPAPRIEPPTPLSGGALDIADWLRLESQLEALQWAPQRTEPAPTVRTFESVPSTLFRCVLVEDLRGCVVDVVCGAHLPQEDAAQLAHEFVLGNLATLMQFPARMLLPPGGLFLNSLAVAQGGCTEVRLSPSPAQATSNVSQPLSELFECIPGVAGLGIDDPLLGALGSAVPPLLVEDNTVPVTGAYAPLDLAQLRSTGSSPEAQVRALLDAPERVEFVRNCLRQMLAAHPRSNIVQTSWLSFEYGLSVAERDFASATPTPTTADICSTTAAPSARYPFSVPRSLAKSLLRGTPLNLSLLNHYALLEYRAGFPDSATSIYTKTLLAMEGMDEQVRLRDAPALLWSYAHMQITRAYSATNDDGAAADATAAGDDASTLIRHALHVLLCASEGRFEPFDPAQTSLRPTRLAKARKAFSGALAGEHAAASWSVADSPLSGIVVSPAACLSACFLWTEYLAHGLEAAQRVWHDVVLRSTRPSEPGSGTGAGSVAGGFVRGDVQHEWLGTIYVRMLTAHRTRHSVPPRLFRAPLLQLLESFPANSFFLSQLAASYAGAGAAGSGELRRYFDQATSGIDWDVNAARRPASDIAAAKAGGLQGRTVMRGSDGAEELLWRAAHEKPRAPAAPIVWLHAVSAELHRPGTVHRIETLLERALQPHSLAVGNAASALALWRLFLRVHVCKGQVGAASKLLYRALHAYPGSKRLWIDGIEWIRDVRDRQTVAAAAATVSGGPSSVSAATEITKDALSDDQIRELFELLQEKEVRHRANLLPERESDSEYRPVERAWDRHLRMEREERQRSEERRLRRRSRHRRRRRGGRSRSRSVSASRSRSRSRSHSSSRSRSCSRSRSRHRRSRSSSRSRSPSRSTDDSRSVSRSRSRSSSEERWRRQRRRERAPLPQRDED